MAKFNATQYKMRLETSTSCTTCEKVPQQTMFKHDRFIFISYSHKDYKKVYADLADLRENNIPFWYDAGLPAGEHWDEIVQEIINHPKCVGVIFYMSENFILSSSIQKEIKSTLHNNKAYFAVNLTNRFPSQVLSDIFHNTYASDFTEQSHKQVKWLQQLSGIFPDQATYVNYDNPNHKGDLLKQIGVTFGIDPNYQLYDFNNAYFHSGTGIIEFDSGEVYEGSFLNNAFWGQGKLTFPFGYSYDGEWVNGRKHGKGTLTHGDGSVYTGDFIKDVPHGYGTITYRDGTTYSGQWQQGHYHGQGTMICADGTVLDGLWENDEFIGKTE